MKKLSLRFDLKDILAKIDRFEFDIKRLLESSRPPPDDRGPFSTTKERWKKEPDKQ